MSNEALGHVWRHSPHNGPAFLVLIAIADIVNDANDNDCWMSLQSLADKTRLAKSTIQSAVAKLEEDGWLIRIEANKGKTVRYHFNIDYEREVVWNSTKKREATIPPFGTLQKADHTATRYAPYRETVRTIPPHGTNTNINTNKTNSADSDKNDISKNIAPNGATVQKLVALYVDNFIGEFKPNPAETGKNIKRLIEQGHKPERLAELIPGIAMSGRKVTAGTLGFEASLQAPTPSQPPTPTPPPFTAADVPQGVPMPDNIKAIVERYRKQA